jgi:hypothetical protein
MSHLTPKTACRIVFPMLAPLGLSQLILALWLLAKGFRSPADAVGGSSA